MPDIFVADTKKDTSADQKILANARPSSSSVAKKLHSNDNIPTGRNRIHLFSSICRNPDDIVFQNQEENETVLLFVRKAFVTNLKWIIIAIVLALLPFVFAGFRPPFLPERFHVIFLLFYFLITASYLYVNFITWYFNISLVTDIRVVDVDFSGLVYKNVASTKLNLVQDVSYSQIGVIRTFFDYGDVLVQTAGTVDNFDFDSVPQPENVVHLIGDLIGKA